MQQTFIVQPFSAVFTTDWTVMKMGHEMSDITKFCLWENASTEAYQCLWTNGQAGTSIWKRGSRPYITARFHHRCGTSKLNTFSPQWLRCKCATLEDTRLLHFGSLCGSCSFREVLNFKSKAKQGHTMSYLIPHVCRNTPKQTLNHLNSLERLVRRNLGRNVKKRRAAERVRGHIPQPPELSIWLRVQQEQQARRRRRRRRRTWRRRRRRGRRRGEGGVAPLLKSKECSEQLIFSYFESGRLMIFLPRPTNSLSSKG